MNKLLKEYKTHIGSNTKEEVLSGYLLSCHYMENNKPRNQKKILLRILKTERIHFKRIDALNKIYLMLSSAFRGCSQFDLAIKSLCKLHGPLDEQTKQIMNNNLVQVLSELGILPESTIKDQEQLFTNISCVDNFNVICQVNQIKYFFNLKKYLESLDCIKDYYSYPINLKHENLRLKVLLSEIYSYSILKRNDEAISCLMQNKEFIDKFDESLIEIQLIRVAEFILTLNVEKLEQHINVNFINKPIHSRNQSYFAVQHIREICYSNKHYHLASKMFHILIKRRQYDNFKLKEIGMLNNINALLYAQGIKNYQNVTRKNKKLSRKISLAKQEHKVIQVNEVNNRHRLMLHPHFICNLFNNLHGYILLGNNDDQLNNSIKIAEIYFKTIKSPTQCLRNEVAFLRKYVETMSKLIKKPIELIESVISDAHNFLTPTLILQPIVENAIKHASRHVSNIKINIEYEDIDENYFSLSISDNSNPNSNINIDLEKSSLSIINQRILNFNNIFNMNDKIKFVCFQRRDNMYTVIKLQFIKKLK